VKQIQVLLAEDLRIVREGFRIMLELEDDIQVVGEAQDGRQAVELARKLSPEVVLMDIAMPKLNGLEATRQLRHALPGAKVLIFSAHENDMYVKMAADAGAAGFLLKQDCTGHDVCRAIREVHQGKTFFSPGISRRLVRIKPQLPQTHGALTEKGGQLTSRQMEVLQLVAESKANKQIASELGIVIKTVEKHRHNLMEKLDIHDTAGLTRYAMNTGVVESGLQLTLP
jgi:DNA-binding NarL/FixJ family response regulator